MLSLRNHGSSKKYHHDYIGHNYRMEGIQGAVLDVKILQDWTEKRRKNTAKYNQMLVDVGEVLTPYESSECKHVYHLYVVRTKNRDQLQSHLYDNGIGTGIHYPFPLHLTGAYKYLGYKKGDFPVAKNVADEILSLPKYPQLTSNQIEYVCEKIKEFYH